MGMTIVEKILAHAGGVGRIAPGDLAVVEVGTVVCEDVSFYATARREVLKLRDPDRVTIVFDHLGPAPDRLAAEAHAYGRDFVRRFGIKRFHDVGPSQGISHVIVAENGYALPGTVLVCADSHGCAVGALNCAGRGVGLPDMLYAMTTGKAWFRVGETVRYDLVGRLPHGVSSKDVFLHIAQTYGAHANRNVEYGGPALPHLSMSARRTLCTMSAELGAEFAVFEPDDCLIDYVRSRSSAAFEPRAADADAVYAARRQLDLGDMQPLVALPDRVVNNAVPVTEVAGTRIDQAFIGSCANGSLDDLAEAARVVAGRQVALGVRFLVTPASAAVFREALRAGHVQTLTEAGAIVTPATCGACFGGHMGVLGPGETCITASARNFKGRMGDPSARIYMASPATVAASAVAGQIVHPGEIERRHS